MGRKQGNLTALFFVMMGFFTLGNGMEIQGHRGSRGTTPENTLPSFQAALEAGVDAIECDLLITVDQQVVIHHDFFVNPGLCTYLDGSTIHSTPLIRTVTLSELRRLDAGRLKHPKFSQQKTVPGTKIPSLEDLLTWLGNTKGLRLNLEIKRDPVFPDYTWSAKESAKIIVEKVERSGLSDRVYYSSFDPEVLAEVRLLDPQAVISFLFETKYWPDLDESWISFVIKTATSLKANMVSPDQVLLKEKVEVKALQEAGFRVVTWTVNEEKRCQELEKMGVDGVITDYPHRMIQFFDENS